MNLEELAQILQPTEEDLAYEEEIFSHPFQLKYWWQYLEFKAKAPRKVRILLFERALKDFPGSYKLWFAYLDERSRYARTRSPVHKEREAVCACFERALTHLSKMPRIWQEYARFLMDQRKITQTRHAFDRALRALPITQHDRIWPLYIKFARDTGIPDMAIRVYRRYLKLEPQDCEEFIDYLLSCGHYDEACLWLVKAVNNEKFKSKKDQTKHDLWIMLAELVSKHPDKVTSIKAELVIRGGLGRFTTETGRMWTSLADYYIRLGHFEKARDVFEEGMELVSTVRDFSVVFDAYAQFMETLVTSKMNAQEEMKGNGEDDEDLSLQLARLEDIMDRRPLLLSSVLLRQNPHNVHEWHKRAKLLLADPEKLVKCYTEACKTVDPRKAVGKPHSLWISFAKWYESQGDLANARVVFEKGTKVPWKNLDDLAILWCEYVEMEIRNKCFVQAHKLLQRATTSASKRRSREKENQGPVQSRLHRSTRIWQFYADMEESMGSFESTRAVYEKICDLHVATPQIILNFAAFMEENRYFEEAFKAYERGVQLFNFPYARDIWLMYLTKFTARYGGKKLERARDLFEQCLERCPASDSKVFYLLYAKLEEDYGLVRHAMSIFDRACKAVDDKDKVDLFSIYIARAVEYFGVTKTREIYEKAIELLPDHSTRVMCIRYADMEKKLGEIDRARAIYTHCSQFCDPATDAHFWKTWNDFEIQHGNEDTFREMLRVKRSVQAQFSQANLFQVSTVGGVPKGADEMEALERMAEEDVDLTGRLKGIPEEQVSLKTDADMENAVRRATNPEEIELADEAEEVEEKPVAEEIRLEAKPVPEAVFGGMMGALERLKQSKA